MAMKYQKGTVYLSGQKVKMWYGKYMVYQKNQDGKEVRSHRNVAICPKANTPKWKAQQMLQEVIVRESGGPGRVHTLPPDDSVTFRWFVNQRYIPMREGTWSPAYTDMQKHGTLKDTQGILRHASITTTGDVYVQTIEQSVLQAVNSRTAAVLEGWTAPVENMGIAGRNLRGITAIRRSSAKSGKELAVSN